MGVVIEICVKYPGGPTLMKATAIHAHIWDLQREHKWGYVQYGQVWLYLYLLYIY
jgi:hypothetical protein